MPTARLFSLPLASLLVCALGLVACSTEPLRPPEVQLTEEPGEAGPRCSGADCCAEADALDFVPQRQYCSALALDNEGKGAASAAALKGAIAGARAEKIRTHDASGVLCHAYALDAQRAEERGDMAATRSGLDAAVQACRAGFGNASDQAARALLDSADQLVQTQQDFGNIVVQLDEALALARKNGNAQIEADALDAYGRYSALVGRQDDERRLLTEALEMRRKAYGENSYQTGMSYVNLGGSHMRMHQTAQGRAWYERAIAVYGSTIGMGDPVALEVRRAHARSYTVDGEHKRAQELLEAMLPQAVQAYGAQSEDTVALVNDIGNSLQSQSKFAEALQRFEEVLAIRRATVPETVKHGYAAMQAAGLQYEIGGCGASGALGAEVQRIAAHLKPASASNEERKNYLIDAQVFGRVCATPPARKGARKTK